MPHLYRLRKGWQGEHLAKFILSKFSFVAQPSTISDDLGSDFFCTLFKTKEEKFLFPQNSFAIQIKSKKDMDYKKNRLEVTNKLEYLRNLEIPFFVGIVDVDKLKLTIYSGEYISYYFSLLPGYPNVEKLFIHLADKRTKPLVWNKVIRNKCYLEFPKVIEIKINYNHLKNYKKIEKLYNLCKLVQENIATKISNEYIFKRFKDIWVDIFAGPTSAIYFRDNFLKRLAEVFYNLEWLHVRANNQNKIKIKQEFEVYKNLYLNLKKIYGRLPKYLISRFDELNKLIGNEGIIG